jgi:hypothetical protein
MLMTRRATLALLALSLTGCQHIETTNGAETLKATALFSTLNATSDCVQGVDPDTGTPTTATHPALTSAGDAAALHEAGGILGGLLAFAGKFIPAPAPLGDRAPGRVGATPSPAGSPAVTSCAGEHTALTPADPVDHGSQPELLRVPERRP